MNPASELGKLAAGVPKKFSASEITKRTARLRKAQKNRAETQHRHKIMAKTKNPKPRCVNCGKAAKPVRDNSGWTVEPSCGCNPAAQTSWWSNKEMLDALVLPDEKIGVAVRRIVKDFKAIAKKKETFAKEANKSGRKAAGFRAMGIASSFRYCAGRLEAELSPPR